MDILKKIRGKLHDSRAFTLAETLVAILILLMVSSVVAAGMPAAINAYQKVEMVSNAELLLSTTISTLRNELGISKNVTVNGGNTAVTYYNQSGRMMSRIYLDGDKIMYKRNAGSDLSEEGEGEGQRLVSVPMSTKSDLEVKYSSVGINGSKDVVVFNDVEVFKKGKNGNNKVITRRPHVYIRIIS